MPAAASVVGLNFSANKKAGNAQEHAAAKAADATVQATQIATDAQQEFYNQTRQDYTPDRAYGNAALSLLGQHTVYRRMQLNTRNYKTSI
jgi:hypothetical protein